MPEQRVSDAGPNTGHKVAASTCIIHIGMHKTGSTSIQYSLSGFSDPQFLYAKIGATPNHSLAIYSLFAADARKHRMHASRRSSAEMGAYLDEMRADLEKSIAAAGGRTLIISGEGILGLMPEEVERMADYFRARFDKVTVVGYVRPPAAFLSSSFQERVKNGHLAMFRMQACYRNYESQFGRFDRAFGRNNVQLWKFDPNSFPQHDAVADFCDRLGIALPPGKTARRNESLSRQAVVALYTYNKFGARAAANIMDGPKGLALGKFFKGEKFRLSPDAIRPVLETNRADIEWMEARLGESLREDLGAHQDTDVRSEDDLLRPDPAVVATLLGKLGRSAPEGVKGDTPQEIAQLIHALHTRKTVWQTVATQVKPANKLHTPAARSEPAEPAKNRLRGAAASRGNYAMPPNSLRGNRNTRVRAAAKRPKARLSGQKQRQIFAKRRLVALAPLTPYTLVFPPAKIGIIWSPKCACTKVVLWYFKLAGLLDAAMFYNPWPHVFRTQVLYSSRQYFDWARGSDWQNFTWYQFCRDPVKRLLSSYRHNLGQGNADRHISAALARTVSSLEGYSLDDYLRYLAATDLAKPRDPHVKLQVQDISSSVPVNVINIDSVDMLEQMNAIERTHGLPVTDFASINAFQRDEKRRVKFGATEPFSSTRILGTADAKGTWPLEASMLDADTTERIKQLYARDMTFIYGAS